MAPKPALIFLHADGREGERIEISSVLTIGRDKASDVKVKVPSISRSHAKVVLGTNGKLIYEHLSSVNPSIINGEVVRSNVEIYHGDILHLGDTLYQVFNPVPSTPAKAKVSLEAIAEDIPHADRSPIPERKGLPTPMKQAIHQVAGVEREPVKTPKKASQGLPTPLRRAIQSRAATVEVACDPVMQSMHVRYESPVQGSRDPVVKSIDFSAAPLSTNKKKTFFEELREAIAKRRAPSPKASPQVSPKRVVTTSAGFETRLPMRSLQASLHNAIRARFQNRPTTATEQDATTFSSSPIAVTTSAHDTGHATTNEATDKQPMGQRVLLATPLRTAIHSRRKSLQVSSTKPTAEVTSPFGDAGKKKRLATPLRTAIHARAPTASEESSASEAKVEAPIPLNPVEQPVGPPNSSPAPMRSFPTPLRMAIEQRKQPSTPKVATPLAAGASRKRPLEEVEDVAPHSHQKRSRTACAATPAATHATVAAAHSPTPGVTGTPASTSCGEAVASSFSEEGEETEAESEEVQELDCELSRDALVAAAIQISKEVMQQDLPEEAKADLLDDYTQAVLLLTSPGFASPSRASLVVRPRESILRSLEKKGQGREVSSADTDGLSDLIGSLTDQDMSVIEDYAARLPRQLGIDSDEAFAVALDAYVRGVEQAVLLQQQQQQQQQQPQLQQPLSPVDGPPSSPQSLPAPSLASPASPHPATSSSKEDVQASRKPRDRTAPAAMLPLGDLFALPVSYLDALSSSLDEQLVEAYAAEIQSLSMVDSAVAFGVALDTFAADPVLFRHRVGKLALPRLYAIAFAARGTETIETAEATGEEADDTQDGHLEDERKDLQETEDAVPASQQTPSQKRRRLSAETATPAKATASPLSTAKKSHATPKDLDSVNGAEEPSVAELPAVMREASPLPPSRTPRGRTPGGARKTPAKISANSHADQVEQVALEVVGHAVKASPLHDNTPKPAATPARRTTPRFTRVQVEEVEVPATQEELAEKKAPVVAITPRRGRGKVAAAAEEEEEDKEGEEERSASTAKAGTRASRSKASTEVVEEAKPAAPRRGRGAAAKTESKEVDVVPAPAKRSRARAVEDEVPVAAPAPAVRSSRSRVAKNAEVEESVEVTAKASKSAAPGGKRSRKAAQPVDEDEMEEAMAILCDGCDKEFFMDEIGLESVPEGDWFCATCAKSRAAKPAAKKKVVRGKK